MLFPVTLFFFTQRKIRSHLRVIPSNIFFHPTKRQLYSPQTNTKSGSIVAVFGPCRLLEVPVEQSDAGPPLADFILFLGTRSLCLWMIWLVPLLWAKARPPQAPGSILAMVSPREMLGLPTWRGGCLDRTFIPDSESGRGPCKSCCDPPWLVYTLQPITRDWTAPEKRMGVECALTPYADINSRGFADGPVLKNLPCHSGGHQSDPCSGDHST